MPNVIDDSGNQSATFNTSWCQNRGNKSLQIFAFCPMSAGYYSGNAPVLPYFQIGGTYPTSGAPVISTNQQLYMDFEDGSPTFPPNYQAILDQCFVVINALQTVWLFDEMTSVTKSSGSSVYGIAPLPAAPAGSPTGTPPYAITRKTGEWFIPGRGNMNGNVLCAQANSAVVSSYTMGIASPISLFYLRGVEAFFAWSCQTMNVNRSGFSNIYAFTNTGEVDVTSSVPSYKKNFDPYYSTTFPNVIMPQGYGSIGNASGGGILYHV